VQEALLECPCFERIFFHGLSSEEGYSLFRQTRQVILGDAVHRCYKRQSINGTRIWHIKFAPWTSAWLLPDWDRKVAPIFYTIGTELRAEDL
jgi:hypothetical protein